MDIPKYKIFEEYAEPEIRPYCGKSSVTIIVNILSKKPIEERDQTTQRLNALRLRKLADYIDSKDRVKPNSSQH